MHIVGLLESAGHVSGRYRLLALKPYVERAGHKLEVRAIPDGFWRRMRFWRRLADADVVILQRRLLSGWHFYHLRRHARRLIYDFDDAVYLRDSYAPKGLESVVRRRRFIRTVSFADAVFAGNLTLQHEAFRYAVPRRVHLVPTCVDPRRYPLAEHVREKTGVVMVWIGSASTLQGMVSQARLWNGIGRLVGGVSLKVICDRWPQFKHLRVLKARWSAATEGREIASADFGISYLPEDDWSRGKCGLKVLQYMAAGLPVIGNPIGVQTELIQHGKTGFLVSKPSDWVEAVYTLANDADLRRQMGQVARRRVEREFSVQSLVKNWLPLVSAVATRTAA